MEQQERIGSQQLDNHSVGLQGDQNRDNASAEHVPVDPDILSLGDTGNRFYDEAPRLHVARRRRIDVDIPNNNNNTSPRRRDILGRRQRRLANHVVQQKMRWKLPGLYSLVSLFVALIAIFTAQQDEQNVGGLLSFLFEITMNNNENLKAKPVKNGEINTMISPIEPKDSPLEWSGKSKTGETTGRKLLSQSIEGIIFLPQWLRNALKFQTNTQVPTTTDNNTCRSNDLSSVNNNNNSLSSWISWGLMNHRVNPECKQSSFVSSVSDFFDAMFLQGSESNTSSDNTTATNKMKSSTETTNNSSRSSKFDLFFSSFRKKVDEHEPVDIIKVNPPWWIALIDPCLLPPNDRTMTDLVNKIQNSTSRLLAIANLLLVITFVLHQSVADWFLGPSNRNDQRSNRNNERRMGGPSDLSGLSSSTNSAFSSSGSSGQDRLGGFLMFKLILIYAVVKPDPFKLLILLSWYTLLSFFLSLVALCAESTTRTAAALNTLATPAAANVNGPFSTATRNSIATHRQQQRQANPGVLRLLLAVLLWDMIAVAACVKLFQKAGIGMVLLLTCDCFVLALDVCRHIIRHWLVVLEGKHLESMRKVEDEQTSVIQQQNTLRQNRNVEELEGSWRSDSIAPASNTMSNVNNSYSDFVELSESPSEDLNETFRHLDRQIEVLEQIHARKSAGLDSCLFIISLFTRTLTILHFSHIWSLHGAKFDWINGILALHLYNAISATLRKISERRNLHRMNTAMNSQFENASVLDLQKAESAGDTCCICRGTMSVLDANDNLENASWKLKSRSLSFSVFSNKSNSVPSPSCKSCAHVKKLACGHLYHTTCLREVIERASPMEAAKCPLCRAPLMPFQQRHASLPNLALHRINFNDAGVINNNNGGRRAQGIGADQPPPEAVLRFSTEGVITAWLNIPAYSFEIVSRHPPTAAAVETNVGTRPPADPVVNDQNIGNVPAVVVEPQLDDLVLDQRVPFRRDHDSFFRRLLVVAGILPHLTPEEERIELERLMEMFPQYDRDDLLRCLRQRGSAQAVTDVIFLNLFPGLPRDVGLPFDGQLDLNHNNNRNFLDNPINDIIENTDM